MLRQRKKAPSRKIAPETKDKNRNHSPVKISSSPKNGSCRPFADMSLNILARMPDNASSSSCVRPPSFWCFFNDVADSALLVMMTTPSRVAGHMGCSHMQPDGIYCNTPAFVNHERLSSPPIMQHQSVAREIKFDKGKGAISQDSAWGVCYVEAIPQPRRSRASHPLSPDPGE